jgi:hypothetical protein
MVEQHHDALSGRAMRQDDQVTTDAHVDIGLVHLKVSEQALLAEAPT